MVTMFSEIGVSTWCCVDRPIGQALILIEEAGYRRIEIWGDDPIHFDPDNPEAVASLKDRISSTTLEAESLHAPFGRHMDISSPDESTRTSAVRHVVGYLQVARDLSLNYLVIHPGHLMQHGEEPERYRMAVRSLEAICPQARDRGVEVCVENLISGPIVSESWPEGYPAKAAFRGHDLLVFCDTLPKVLHLVRSVEGVCPGICVDTSHANVMGNVAEEIEICGDAIRRTHISDNFGQKDDHLPPGDGEIEWRSVLRSLDRIRYSGTLLLEVAGGDDPASRVSRARLSMSAMLSGWRS